jgi:cytochrome P450
MRINTAFDFMVGAVDDYERRLDTLAASGASFSLDAAMSHLTADVITRTIFSTPLESSTSRDVFEDFSAFERRVASIDVRRLLMDKPWAHIPQPEDVTKACLRIRRHLGDMLEKRLATEGLDDIAGAVIEARDTATGQGFTHDEIIDQLGVFFLAGHETTASSLTWAFFLLSQQPGVVARMREEVDRVVGDGPVQLEHTKRLVYVRNMFRETLRLYPPITFIPRVALEDTTIGGRRVKRGTMIMIAPWAMHRHELLWKNPDRFDPDRFLPEREHEMTPGAYMPFGVGPRICVGAAFATIETALILARLVRRFNFDAIDADTVRPFARLTTRPAVEIQMTVRRA